MNRISASNNIIIEIDNGFWRLIQSNEHIGERIHLEVAVNRPLRYTEDFAMTRHLPESRILPGKYVWRVVAGWSHQDLSWHLGLILAKDLADARGSRWCEIVSWFDPRQDLLTDTVHEAGQTLAQILTVPYALIPPQPQKQHPLPELPISAGNWKLIQADSGQLELQRSRRWTIARLLRITWYGLWVLIYVILSAATLNADLALPNSGTMLPDSTILPYLGLGTAAVLFLMFAYLIYELLSSTNRIVMNGATHTISGLRGKSERWSKNDNQVQSIYVTQVIDKKKQKNITYHGELNLHLGSNDFHRVLQHGEEKGKNTVSKDEDETLEEAILPINMPAESISDLQAIGLHIAQVLGGLPCWYDQRVR